MDSAHRADGLPPAAARRPGPVQLVRVDRVRGDGLARPVQHRDLDPGAETRVQAHRRPGARRRGEQQVAQVGGEHGHGLVLGPLPQPHPQVHAEVDADPGPPGPAHGLGQPAVRRAPGGRGAGLVREAEPPRDGGLVVAALVRAVARGAACGGRQARGGRVTWVQGEVEDLLLFPAQHGQDAVRGQGREGLCELEVVREFGPRLLLAFAHPGDEPATRPHPLAQLTDQVSVLREPFGQDRPGPVQGRRHIRHALIRVQVRRGRGARVELRVQLRGGQDLVGQRLESRLPGNLGPGAALRLVRKVDVFQPRLGVSGHDARFERLVELALGPDRLQDRVPPLGQLPQIAQPFLQCAQLRVVEAAGRFLAVAGDERHGGPAVEQVHGRFDLPFPRTEFPGDLALDRHRSSLSGRCHDLGPPSQLDCHWSLAQHIMAGPALHCPAPTGAGAGTSQDGHDGSWAAPRDRPGSERL